MEMPQVTAATRSTASPSVVTAHPGSWLAGVPGAPEARGLVLHCQHGGTLVACCICRPEGFTWRLAPGVGPGHPRERTPWETIPRRSCSVGRVLEASEGSLHHRQGRLRTG